MHLYQQRAYCPIHGKFPVNSRPFHWLCWAVGFNHFACVVHTVRQLQGANLSFRVPGFFWTTESVSNYLFYISWLHNLRLVKYNCFSKSPWIFPRLYMQVTMKIFGILKLWDSEQALTWRRTWPSLETHIDNSCSRTWYVNLWPGLVAGHFIKVPS